VENICKDLDEALTKYRAYQIFVMGDFNSKIGKRKVDGEKKLIGPYGIGTINKRGEKLIQFAQEYNLFISNSYYKKTPQKKWTWQSPDWKTHNKIDFILSNTREGITDVKILNGANFDADRRMVRATIELQKKRRYTKGPTSQKLTT
jgi:hypothetical protein